MSTTPLSVAVIGAGMAGTTHANAWRQVGTVFDLGLPPVRLRTIADAYLGVFASWLGRLGGPFDQLQAVKRVRDAWAARPAVQAALSAEGLR